MSVFTSMPLTEGIPADGEDVAAVAAVPVPVTATATAAPIALVVADADAVPTTNAPIALVGVDPVPDIPSLKRIPRSSALPSAATSPTSSGTNTPALSAGSRSPVRRYPGYTALSPALASPATSAVLSPCSPPSDGPADDAGWPSSRDRFPKEEAETTSSADGGSSATDSNGLVPLRRFPRRAPSLRRSDAGDISTAGPESDDDPDDEEAGNGAPLCRFPRPVAPPPSSGAEYHASSGGGVSPPFLVFGSGLDDNAGEAPASTPVRSVPRVSGLSWTSESSARTEAPGPSEAGGGSGVQLLLTLVPVSEEVLDAMAGHFLGAAEGIREAEEGFRDFTVVHRGEVLPEELLVMFT